MESLNRLDLLLQSIEAERKHEEDYYLNVIAEKSLLEKVKEGVAIHRLDLINRSYASDGRIVVELEKKERTYSPNRLKTGIGILLTIVLNEKINTFKGTISFKRKGKLKLILNGDQDIDDIPTKGKISVEMTYDERPYRVMKQAIHTLQSTDVSHLVELREGVDKLSAFDYDLPGQYYHAIKELNNSQNKAIQGCLMARRFGIIHGPPGTGKTTTIVGLVSKLLIQEKQILVCASSNNAVDLLAKKLFEKGIKVLRIGNISRIGEENMRLSLDDQIRTSTSWQQIKKMRQEGLELAKKANKYKRSFGPDDRKMRISLRKESRETMKWAKEMEKRLSHHIVDEAEVILATLIGASHYTINHKTFKTCVIDEASQALEPESWNVINKAERVILVGDHKQLPPTVKSPKGMKLGFETTLLDRMSSVIKHCYQLKVQYRMNEAILGFPNQQYYDDKLVSSPEVKNRFLHNDLEAVSYIDTAGTGFNEEQLPNERSYFNNGEYLLLQQHLSQHIEMYKGESIGIITPYAAQVRHLRKSLELETEWNELDIEVNSIDGFQGQEKDVIYLSLVRSNDMGQIGFLKDERRLNVALTRAKKKIIIIGDSATIASYPIYAALVDHIEQYGSYQSAFEYDI